MLDGRRYFQISTKLINYACDGAFSAMLVLKSSVCFRFVLGWNYSCCDESYFVLDVLYQILSNFNWQINK